MRIVITGTDTHVGKTWIGIALATALRPYRPVRAVKLVESGCVDASRVDEDGYRLARATGQERPDRALVRLCEAVTPALAADREAVDLDLRALCAEARTHEPSAVDGREGVLLVEGAGGLLSPITYRHSLLDAAVILQAKVLIVGVDQLGVLNHALLTISALQSEGLSVLGVVLTPPAVADASTGTNALLLGRISGVPVTTVPRIDDPSSAAACREIAPLVRWLDGASQPARATPLP